ncbi:hypothetical protein BGX31_002872 [Mortierella sp. GBA43]|nr:hypothetical protein BGX31_002872 [Mortierella sp. GBA43]
MKFSLNYRTATAVALVATVFAFPGLYKRVADLAKVSGCLIQGVATGTFSQDCQDAVRENAGLIKAFDATDLIVNFVTKDPTTIELSSTGLKATLIPIKGFNWPLAEAAQEESGTPVAVYRSQPAAVAVTNGIFVAPLNNTSLQVLPGQMTNFTKLFMAAIIQNAEHMVVLRGTANITLNTSPPTSPAPAPPGPVPPVPAPPTPPSPIPKTFTVNLFAFEASLTIKGCANFPDTPFVKTISFTFNQATGDYTLTYLANIKNRSILVMDMGDITYQAVDNSGTVFGTTVFANVKLTQGNNNILTAVTTFKSKDVYNALTTVGLHFRHIGFAGSSPVPILSQALSAVNSTMELPKQAPIA